MILLRAIGPDEKNQDEQNQDEKAAVRFVTSQYCMHDQPGVVGGVKPQARLRDGC